MTICSLDGLFSWFGTSLILVNLIQLKSSGLDYAESELHKIHLTVWTTCRGLALNYKGNSLEDEKAPKCQHSEVDLYFSLFEMIETSFYVDKVVFSELWFLIPLVLWRQWLSPSLCARGEGCCRLNSYRISYFLGISFVCPGAQAGESGRCRWELRISEDAWSSFSNRTVIDCSLAGPCGTLQLCYRVRNYR